MIAWDNSITHSLIIYLHLIIWNIGSIVFTTRLFVWKAICFNFIILNTMFKLIHIHFIIKKIVYRRMFEWFLFSFIMITSKPERPLKLDTSNKYMNLYSTKILKYVVRDNILVVNKISLDFIGKHWNEKLIKNHVTTRVLLLTRR